MILIADSGSTKTAWRLIDSNKKIHQFSTQGFNPYFQDTPSIVRALENELLVDLKTEAIDQIYFYGAGCSSLEKSRIVYDALINKFKNASIEVEHDLLAAARALCGRKPGIAAILGTGSNSCYFDGEIIVENIPSLGFILGDEGSGAHLGKTFLKLFLDREVPRNIADRFTARFKINQESILDAVYKQPLPNRYLASFAKFIYQNSSEPFFHDLVVSCFEAFMDKHICKYSNHQEVSLNIVGSVGFYFSDIIKKVAQSRSIRIDTILESPIAGLTLFHLNES